MKRAQLGTAYTYADLPGCVAVAESEEDVRELIAEAIEFHRDGLREEGYPIPEPRSASAYVEVAA